MRDDARRHFGRVRYSGRPVGAVSLLLLAGGVFVAALTLVVSCGSGNQSPIAVAGPNVLGNRAPQLVVLSPFEDLSLQQGDSVTILWTDSDPDSAATIAFDLVSVLNGSIVIPLIDGLPENDVDSSGNENPESVTVSTNVVAPGEYFIRGTIRDGINAPVFAYASTDDINPVRVVATISPESFLPVSQPPQVVVLTPRFNQTFAQDEQLLITVQPTTVFQDPDNPPANPVAYDADSDATLYVLLDVDNNPNNDNPRNPDSSSIIVLATRQIVEGAFAAINFNELVDLAEIPVRPDGSPYFVRATIQDESNPPFHAYARGTVSIGQAVSGTVDLGLVGGTLLGATFEGFNPGSHLGSRMISARDFDADGVDDFLFVAQFGNPRNLGNIGEGYLIYGQNQIRYGGRITVNSTSTDVPGAIFEGTPVRFFGTGLADNARTDGITDVATITDLSGDGRPELLFGLAHVDGSVQARDDDPGDDPPEFGDTVNVELMLRQGFCELTVGGQDPAPCPAFNGFEDVVIDSANPGTNFGSDVDLEWDNDGPAARKWVLFRIRGLLDAIPDSPALVTGLNATMTVRVVNEGDDGNVHEVLTPFTESTVTFNNFAQNGGAPEEMVDYEEEELGGLGGAAGATADLTLTPLIQKLVDGELADVGNDVLFIVVAADDGMDNTRIRSSEFNTVIDDRPTLNITYQRRVTTGQLGCYPDSLPNNIATEFENTIPGDINFQASGYVAILHSENRDNDGLINTNRLEATSVPLELVGQQADPALLLGGAVVDLEEGEVLRGPISIGAQGDEEGRTAGARFQSGAYDYVDHLFLGQPPIEDAWGWSVDSLPDIDNDQQDEIIISAPTNELDIENLMNGGYFPFSTHLAGRTYTGSIIVFTGTDYDDDFWRDTGGDQGTASIPVGTAEGSCSPQDPESRRLVTPFETYEIFAEDPDDFLSGGRNAGDFNLDGVADLLCGAPQNDPGGRTDAGAVYVIYNRVPVGDVRLTLADNPLTRPPMLRIRGDRIGDRLGTAQERIADINGDRIEDIVVGSPFADAGGVGTANCAVDFNEDGVINDDDLSATLFVSCLGNEVFLDDDCKAFDYDNDRFITEDDQVVLECLQNDGGSACCPVDNGVVGVVFGGVSIDGDRTMSQVATNDLPGVYFYGTNPGDRAGTDVGSAGDFNQDGFGDLLIAAPGESREDAGGQTRLGVVYLVFGGTHLHNQRFDLAQVGSDELPGIVFLSPFVAGRPNEAAPDHVGNLGDINNDGFSDIAIGNTRADFIDSSLPQTPGDPGTDPSTGRRPDAGEIYLIYGNNFGGNR